jgi:hypothetical protein
VKIIKEWVIIYYPADIIYSFIVNRLFSITEGIEHTIQRFTEGTFPGIVLTGDDGYAIHFYL